MKAKLLSYCKAESLFSPGDRVICGVSGGADSMALLHCLHSLEAELEITVEAAHFNHKLRGEESDGDETFVKDFCHQIGIPLLLGQEDVAQYSRDHHMGPEEAARQCRYAFFRSLGGKIATAHNADDNLETVLMHLIRGSGLRGLCGIPPKRDNIVRPLLFATREEILAYLEKEGLSYREDSSNHSLSYTRNRIRHHVLPLLRGENPEISHGILQQSRLLRSEDRLLDMQAKELLQRDETGAYFVLPLLSAPDPLQRRALRLMVGEYLEQDVSLVHIEALQELLRSPIPSAQVSLPHSLTACRSYDILYFTRDQDTAPSLQETPLQIPGETEIPGTPWKIFCKIQKNFIKMTNTPFHFAIKYDMISASVLHVRSRQTGDSLQLPHGHSKSLKKLMIDRKIPRQDRDLLPVITDGQNILAVAGLGIHWNCRPQEGQPALIVSIERGEPSCTTISPKS